MASFADNHNFDGYPRIFAAGSFGAGGPMLSMLRDGVWDDDFRFEIGCLTPVTEAMERAVFILLGSGVKQAEIARYLGWHPQTVRGIID